MKFVKTFAFAAALALAGTTACVTAQSTGISAAPNPTNVLDTYVARPDPSFAWKVEKTFTGPGYRGAVLDLTSQTWLSDKQTDRSVWKHWLIVTIPDAVSSDKGFLFIGGGSNGRAAPNGPSENMAKMAVDTNSVVAELGQAPNQPMRLAGSMDTPAYRGRHHRLSASTL